MSKEISNPLQFLILSIGKHHFAVNVSNIEDVIQPKRKTVVPLSKPNISGLLNLRGHIVTEISVAKTLGIKQTNKQNFSVVVSRNEEMYSLAFDAVGDVLEIQPNQLEPLPETVQQIWHQVSKGVYRMGEQLVVVLDLETFVELLLEEDNVELDELQSA